MTTPIVDDHAALDARRDEIFENILDHVSMRELEDVAQNVLAYKLSHELLQFIMEHGEFDEYKSLQEKAER